MLLKAPLECPGHAVIACGPNGHNGCDPNDFVYAVAIYSKKFACTVVSAAKKKR